MLFFKVGFSCYKPLKALAVPKVDRNAQVFAVWATVGIWAADVVWKPEGLAKFFLPESQAQVNYSLFRFLDYSSYVQIGSEVRTASQCLKNRDNPAQAFTHSVLLPVL